MHWSDQENRAHAAMNAYEKRIAQLFRDPTEKKADTAMLKTILRLSGKGANGQGW